MAERCREVERVEWVGERAVSRGGAWALGCIVCAQAVLKLAGESSLDARQKRGRLESKWARFEVRTRCLQAHTLALHSQSEAHKMAMGIFVLKHL